MANFYGGGMFSPYPQQYPVYNQSSVQQYQQMQAPQQMMSQPQQQTYGNNFLYVNGLEGAKAYIISPNTSALLMDSDNPTFYIKSANSLGQSALKQFNFSEVPLGTYSKNATQEIHAIDKNAVCQDDIKSLKDEMLRMEERLTEKIGSVKQTATAKQKTNSKNDTEG